MDGIINIYKEKGFTSHDVVAKLRGILKMKRIGHTGTLDPEAEGVLPVCLGTATRLCDMLTDKIKAYRTVVRFGIATDTEDMTGQVIKESSVPAGEQELKEILQKFTGTYEQIPPMYSAIKVEGKKLYELAREGKVIERKGRPVTIHSIELHSVELDASQHLFEAELTVVCGKGTYIRSLCRDIGEALGTCACMKSLLRIRSGNCFLAESLKLSEVEQLRDAKTLEKHIMPVEQVFAECKSFQMKQEWDRLLLNGNHIPEEACAVFTEPLRKSVDENAVTIQHRPNHLLMRSYDSDSSGQKSHCEAIFHGFLPRNCEGTEQLQNAEAEFPENWFRAYDSKNKFLGVYEKTGEKFIPVKMFL